MSELQKIREKYHNKDFIEITGELQLKIVDWLSGGSRKDNNGQVDIRKVAARVSEMGFIKFLNKGVIVAIHNSPIKALGVFPFEFTDNGTLKLSVYIADPTEGGLALLCKVEVGTDTHFETIEGTWNEALGAAHMGMQFAQSKLGMPLIEDTIRLVRKHSPDLKPNGAGWNEAITQEYFNTLIKAQIITVIGVNTYLSLLEKEILISKIEQKRIFNASDKGGKKSKRNPLYRYVVELPKDYKPRSFNVNYVLSQWNRSAFTTKRWVRKENAEVLAKRRNGKVLNIVRGNLVAIEIPMPPAECFRRKKSVAENIGTKVYSS